MPSMKKSRSSAKLAAEKAVLDKAKALRQYVTAALSGRVREPSSPQYQSFVKELQALRRKLEADPEDAAAEFSLVALIQALRDCASSVKEGCHDAVLTTVLSISLWSCSQPVRTAVLELVVELISTGSTFVSNCLQVLLFNLLPPPGSAPLAPDEPGEPWEPAPLAVDVQAAVVGAMEQAVQLVPALPARLLPMLLQNMPHKLRDRSTQCLFLSAVIALCEGKVGHALRESLLAGVVEHLLSIDADIRWEDIVDAPTGYDHEESDDGQDELFDLEGLIDLEIDPADSYDAQQHQQDQLAALHDGFHDPAAFAAAGQHGARRQQQLAAAAAAAGDGSAAAAAAAAAAAKPAVDVTADKLDSLMELTMQHLQRRVAAGQLGSVWQTLLRVFESRLIHAHRCKFSQFLLFYLTVQDPERCSSSFSACLMSMLRDGSQPAITRCACASYLASFLARCALAPQALVVDVLHKLTSASQEYADAALAAAHRHQQQQQGGGGVRRIGSSSGSKSSMSALKGSSSDAALVLLAGLSDLMGQGPLNGVATAAASGAGSNSSGALAAIQRHQVFYAMVQALLYLLCYHLQPLLGGNDSSQAAGGSNEQQQQLGQAVAALVRQQVLPLLSHPLAPLAVCHQAVTAEFVRQALLLGLADAEWEAAALEAVSQHQAALTAAASAASAIVIGGDGMGGEGGTQPRVLRPLEVFFPFDPYLLKRSARFLQLSSSYTCFSHGQPHAAGAARQRRGRRGAGAGAGGDGVDSAVADADGDDDDDTSSEDEGDWEEAAGGSGSGSDDGSSSSSGSGSGSEDGEDGDPTAAGAGGAGGAGNSRLRRPGGAGLLPVGLAAAARQHGMLVGSSGPSPPPDMMATSLLSNGVGSYLVGGSYESAEHNMHGLFGAAAAAAAGVSPAMLGVGGGSPMPMSITPYEGSSYMANVQAQLQGMKQQGGGGSSSSMMMQ